MSGFDLVDQIDGYEPRWPHRGMTWERWDALDGGNDEDGPHLTEEEIAAGWHFCYGWDGLLLNLNDDSDSGYEFCTCNRAKERK